ncbi:MAG TPA: N-acetylglucosamine-6-phosphate deacetylase [Pyrinomonadaceae bacterium]
MSIVLKNGRAVIGNKLVDNPSIVVAEGRIVDMGGERDADVKTIDCTGLTVMPGFIDVHIHGAIGFDVNDADTAGLLEIARFLAGHGVTSWMPTLVPDSDENYQRVIHAINRLMEIQSVEPVAQAVGVHYEGVFASERMCGALRPEFFKTFTGNEVDRLPRLKQGVHMMTFAPEIEGGIELTRELVQKGWIASIGHTSADVQVLDDAFNAGAHHLTHFYNAMTGLHHRSVGVVGWALANKDVTFDIIADGVHVHPSMLEFACRSKSPAKVSLISDSVAPTGLGDGEFIVWEETITVKDGRTENRRGAIAGSVITLLDAFKRMRILGFSEAETARMASHNPAALLGIGQARGSIAVEKHADLIALDAHGNLRLVMIGGSVVHTDIA